MIGPNERFYNPLTGGVRDLDAGSDYAFPLREEVWCVQIGAKNYGSPGIDFQQSLDSGRTWESIIGGPKTAHYAMGGFGLGSDYQLYRFVVPADSIDAVGTLIR